MKPELQQDLTQRAYVAPLQPNTPDSLRELIAAETRQWTTILRERKIAPGQ
jgi:hypothetical protein